MNIPKNIVEQTFDMVGENLGAPTEDEVTARMMHEQYPQLGHRQWLNRLRQGVKDGKYTVRYGKRNECIFKPTNSS